jgi:lipid A disaccharide synthetase
VDESLLLVVRCSGCNGVGQTEIHVAEALVPKSGAFELEMALLSENSVVSYRVDAIAAELIHNSRRN